ncbi:cytochrome c biogenesis CcdA family protein [Falsiphaeobacter marinintestinus]|uniref:cytochrome c biogenesis CcdA family protein n=1 Tax=Falsiphaeobacter marinintestinus TaxID=1492905 RepID=UPI0011B77694|nr:cytochrome c biogenesis CcdA family protein [Phaeobacter marinintestinus]
MDLLLAYIAGLLTLINPCVLPVLPIVLGTALQADRRGPLALALGMSVSFVLFGMLISTVGYSIGLTQERLAQVGATLMIVFGLILLVPAFATRFELAFSGVAAHADSTITRADTGGLSGQFLGGLLLGAVWSPCIGPTLGSAIALASQGQNLFWSFLVMCFFAAGVSTLILGLGLGGQHLIRQRATQLRGLAARSKPILGATFVIVGVAILFKVHHMLEAWAVRNLPTWFNDLSIAI